MAFFMSIDLMYSNAYSVMMRTCITNSFGSLKMNIWPLFETAIGCPYLSARSE